MTNIGIFDTGLGGINVLNKMAHDIKAHYYYFGDSLRVPYGSRKISEIREFSRQIVKFLEKFDIDFYIIACNTISVTSKEILEEEFKKKFYSITQIGVDYAKKFEGDYLVLATSATVNSHFYKNNLESNNKKVFEIKADALVKEIEEGLLDSKQLNKLIDTYISIANDKKIDNIILGCTHFPIIEDQIRDRLTYRANIINPASFILDKINTSDKDLSIDIFMSKKTKACEILIPELIDYDYKLTYTKELI